MPPQSTDDAQDADDTVSKASPRYCERSPRLGPTPWRLSISVQFVRSKRDAFARFQKYAIGRLSGCAAAASAMLPDANTPDAEGVCTKAAATPPDRSTPDAAKKLTSHLSCTTLAKSTVVDPDKLPVPSAAKSVERQSPAWNLSFFILIQARLF